MAGLDHVWQVGVAVAVAVQQAAPLLLLGGLEGGVQGEEGGRGRSPAPCPEALPVSGEAAAEQFLGGFHWEREGPFRAAAHPLHQHGPLAIRALRASAATPCKLLHVVHHHGAH